MGGLDDRNLWVYQTFHHSKNSNERGKVLAQVFTQAVIVRDKEVINPRSWIEDTVPVAKDDLDDLTTSGEVESLFDEKSTRFMHLEDSLRRSAAIHDDQVTK